MTKKAPGLSDFATWVLLALLPCLHASINIAELDGMKFSQLRKLAKAEKIADNLVDVALEEENPRLALVKVLKGAAATAATTTEGGAGVDLADYEEMKFSKLRKICEANEAIPRDTLDAALDADQPREALLALLKARLETSALAPLEDLSGLPLKELMARAKIEHCDPDEVDEAMDADQPKPALINVIRQKLVTKLARNRMEAAEMKEMGIRQLEEDKNSAAEELFETAMILDPTDPQLPELRQKAAETRVQHEAFKNPNESGEEEGAKKVMHYDRETGEWAHGKDPQEDAREAKRQAGEAAAKAEAEAEAAAKTNAATEQRAKLPEGEEGDLVEIAIKLQKQMSSSDPEERKKVTSTNLIQAWQAVIDFNPQSWNAHRQIGHNMYRYGLKDPDDAAIIRKMHDAFRHLITALPHLPDDYWSYHELGTGLKLLADRLDVAEEAIGALEDATRFCDRARWMLPKLQEGVVSEVMQKVLYLHCCDIYDSWALDKPEKQQECAEEAVAIKLFPSRWQRPAKFFVPDLETKPWWDIEEVIGGFADGYPEMVDVLEKVSQGFEAVKAEAVAAFEAGKFSSQNEILESAIDGELTALNLIMAGSDVGCSDAPQTCAMLKDTIASVTRVGGIKFLAHGAETDIRPMSGPANFRIKVELPLQVPSDCAADAGCGLRVGGEQRQGWIEGKSKTHDSSFEHDSANTDKISPVLLLVIDFLHPQLRSQKEWYTKTARESGEWTTET